MAVQSGSPLNPVTPNRTGDASLTEALDGATLPLAHERLTVTLAALSGWKSLLTSNWAKVSPEVSTGSPETSEE